LEGVGDLPDAGDRPVLHVEDRDQQGLKIEVRILEKVYETGRKCAAGFKKAMKIVFDEFLPKWNYRAVPEPV
jgi:hypothetical protein